MPSVNAQSDPGMAQVIDRVLSRAESQSLLLAKTMEEIPDALLERLQPGGVLIAPVGPMDDKQVLVRVARTADGFDRQELVAVRFVPALAGIAREL